VAAEAMRRAAMGGHLTGDVPALLLVAIVLGILMTGVQKGSVART
jgi:hypothetical protein